MLFRSETKGLVRDASLFQIQLKLSAYSKKIKTGVYTLNTSMTPKEMIVFMAGAADSTEEDTENSTQLEEATEGLAPAGTEAELETEAE